MNLIEPFLWLSLLIFLMGKAINNEMLIFFGWGIYSIAAISFIIKMISLEVKTRKLKKLKGRKNNEKEKESK